MTAAACTARGHDVLEEIVFLSLRLTCRTGLHIGAGKSSAMAGSELPILRDAGGRPLIPGSSLRGILRSGVEALVGSFELTASAAPGEENSGDEDDFLRDWRGMTLVERLFGRVTRDKKDPVGSYASRVQISDFQTPHPVVVELRDGVAIERESRTAQGATGGKFDVEVVPAGTVFTGRIRLRNSEAFEIGLLAQALVMLDQGLLLLGGKSARGLGWMQVESAEPVRLTARALLDGLSSTPEEAAFGPPQDKLASSLEALRALVTETPTNGNGHSEP